MAVEGAGLRMSDAPLRRYPADEMKAFPISTLVNSPKNDVPGEAATRD
jgi:hypothetical protein